MYVNRISVAVSQKEGFLKAECIAPRLNEGEGIKNFDVIESCELIMSREMLKEMASLIENVLNEETTQE